MKPALKWVEEQRAWVEAQRARLPERRPFVPGASIPFRGTKFVVEWQPASPRRVVLDGDRLILGGPIEAVPRRVETWLRRAALEVFVEETEFFAARADVNVDACFNWRSARTMGPVVVLKERSAIRGV